MDNNASDKIDGRALDEFEEKFTQLLALCKRLKAENIALQARQALLLESHTDLVGKNELARTKVSSILARLRQAELEV